MTNKQWNREKKPADARTWEKNRTYLMDQGIPPLDPANPEYAQMKEGCILALTSEEDYVIREDSGEVVLDLRPYYFIKQDTVPDSVNPSLFMIAKANLTAGVYAFCERNVIQVRGISVNTTLIRSKHGWILVDLASSKEAARAGILLAERALHEPVYEKIQAVIVATGITDLYGNKRGGLYGAIKDREVPVYAIPSFGRQMIRESVSSNVVNMRKVPFQFGSEKPGADGYVTTGFTIGVPGGSDVFRSDRVLPEQGSITIDGLTVCSEPVGDIGTPAEIVLYFPKYRTLWVGELLIGMLHNIYTVRGAKVRDARAWAGHIYDLYVKYSDHADLLLQSCNWSHKNTKEQPDAVAQYLLHTASLYQYIHDQTLHYAMQGYRVEDIISKLEYPKGLREKFYAGPYYGSLEMGIRGVYSSWFGSADGNPVNLRRQTKEEQAAQFIEYVGSVQQVFEKAEKDYKQGHYQRAIEALDKIMFYDPEYEPARCLLADLLEQLGYQAECATMRNAYLNGAKELREGVGGTIPEKDRTGNAVKPEWVSAMPDEEMLAYVGITLDGKKVEGEELTLLLTVHPEKELEQDRRYLVTIKNGSLLYCRLATGEDLPKQAAQAVPVTTAPGMLAWLVSHPYEEIAPWIQTTKPQVLRRLKSYLVDPLLYLDYPIMEKR